MSFIGDAIRMAFASIWGQKVRSLLTILGVVIGIGAVVAMTSMGASFEDSITGEFDGIDDRTIFVSATLTDVGGGPPDAGGFGTVFTERDIEEILELDNVERVDPQGTVIIAGMEFDENRLPVGGLTAVTAVDDQVADDDAYYDGGPFEDGDRAIVIGWTLALFLGGDDLDEENPSLEAGDDVIIYMPDGTNDTVEVAGILAESDALFGSGNTAAFVPIDPFYTTTIQGPNGRTTAFGSLSVIATERDAVDGVKEDLTDYIENDSDAAALTEDIPGMEFLVSTASDIQAQISTAIGQFTAFIAGIGGVALVVGGIMIATIMLISVTERTKEIGVMKAIGGRDRDILTMFLLEATIIGFIGSIVGVIVGMAAGFALVEGFFSDQDITFVIDQQWLVGGVVLGLLVGIIAGILPARRATKVQPVEALSYE